MLRLGESWEEHVKTLAHPSLYPDTDPLDVYVELVDPPRRLAAAILDALREQGWCVTTMTGQVMRAEEHGAQQERERLRERLLGFDDDFVMTVAAVRALLADPDEADRHDDFADPEEAFT